MNTTYHVTLFGMEFDINRVAFTLPITENGWPIYWYGILISVGFLLALIYAFRNAKRFGIDSDRLVDVVLVTTPFAILGARLYYLLFDGNGIESLKNFFSIHDGGLAIYGGVIVAAIVAAIMCKIRKLRIADVLDVAAIGFLIGQAVGRWGNFFNQEAFGRAVYGSFLPKWFGMTSEAVTDFYYKGVMVHPCFLYESLWCIAGFVLLHILSKHRKFSGEIALMYGVWYGTGRFFIEGLRTDSLMLGQLRVSQLVSAAAVIVCAVLLVIMLLRKNKKSIPTDYTPMFAENESSSQISGSPESDETKTEIEADTSIEAAADDESADKEDIQEDAE